MGHFRLVWCPHSFARRLPGAGAAPTLGREKGFRAELPGSPWGEGERCECCGTRHKPRSDDTHAGQSGTWRGTVNLPTEERKSPGQGFGLRFVPGHSLEDGPKMAATGWTLCGGLGFCQDPFAPGKEGPST